MALKAIYEKKEDIPEKFLELYSERGGKWELNKIEGLSTQADMDRVNEALRKEREDHKASKDKIKAWDGLDADEVRAKLDTIPELEAQAEAGKGKIDEEKVKELVDQRTAVAMRPLEAENAELKAKVSEQDEVIAANAAEKKTRTIHDSVRSAMSEMKVRDSAHEDVLLLSERVFDVSDSGDVLVKDDMGTIPGASPLQWLKDMQPKREHWWAASQGSGAGGSSSTGADSDNPWTPGNWNLTAQGRYLTEHGAEKAAAAAKAAGSQVGATKPPVKA